MHWQFGEMKFGEMKRNTSNWSNFGMLLRRAGLTASAELSCHIGTKRNTALGAGNCFVVIGTNWSSSSFHPQQSGDGRSELGTVLLFHTIN